MGGVPSIDACRGIATLMVVLFHAGFAEPSLSTSAFCAVNQALAFVRMPLFMIITGYLLGVRPPSCKQEQVQRLRSWIVRLGWPLLVVTLAGVGILRAQDVRWPLIPALIFGSWHLWYLQALLLLRLGYGLIELAWRPSANQLVGLALAAALVATSGIAASWALFSAHRAIELLPFLLVGAWVGRRPRVLDRRALPCLLYLAAASALVVQQAAIAGFGPLWPRPSWPAMLAGAGSGLWLLRHAPRSPVLELIGRYSFPIFLWHVPWSVTIDLLVLTPGDIAGAPAVALRVAAGLLLPPLVVRAVCATRLLPIVMIGDAAPRRAPPLLPHSTASGYRSPLRRFASGMNHPC